MQTLTSGGCICIGTNHANTHDCLRNFGKCVRNSRTQSVIRLQLPALHCLQDGDNRNQHQNRQNCQLPAVERNDADGHHNDGQVHNPRHSTPGCKLRKGLYVRGHSGNHDSATRLIVIGNAQLVHMRKRPGSQAVEHILGRDHQAHIGEPVEHCERHHCKSGNCTRGEHKAPVEVSIVDSLIKNLLNRYRDNHPSNGHDQSHSDRHTQTHFEFRCRGDSSLEHLEGFYLGRVDFVSRQITHDVHSVTSSGATGWTGSTGWNGSAGWSIASPQTASTSRSASSAKCPS